MKVPAPSCSTSRAVTSPVRSRSPAGASLEKAVTLTFEPIFAPVFWQDRPVGVAKGQDEQVGLVEVAVNDGRRQKVVDVLGHLHAVDFYFELPR